MAQGRHSKKRPNHERRRTKITTSEAVRPLRVSVITLPETSATGPSLQRDLELMKASLLYADEVELISPGAAITASMVQLGHGGLPAVAEVLSMMDDQTLRHMLGGQLPANFRQMLPLMPLMLDPEVAAQVGPEAEATVANARAELEPHLEQMRNGIEQMALDAGAEELIPALEAGILKLDSAGFEDGDAGKGIQNFCDRIVDRLRDYRRHVLFDAGAGDLARHLVAMNGSELSGGIRRAGEAAVGSGMVARLPAFPQAPTDELLDLRKDLQDPLRRYRAATLKLSKQLLPGSVGAELEAQVDELWRSDVDPALLALEEQVSDHRLVRELAKYAGKDIRKFVMGSMVLYVGLTQAASLGTAAEALITAGAAASPSALRATLDWHKAGLDVKRHELFFLYATNKRLGAVAA